MADSTTLINLASTSISSSPGFTEHSITPNPRAWTNSADNSSGNDTLMSSNPSASDGRHFSTQTEGSSSKIKTIPLLKRKKKAHKNVALELVASSAEVAKKVVHSAAEMLKRGISRYTPSAPGNRSSCTLTLFQSLDSIHEHQRTYTAARSRKRKKDGAINLHQFTPASRPFPTTGVTADTGATLMSILSGPNIESWIRTSRSQTTNLQFITSQQHRTCGLLTIIGLTSFSQLHFIHEITITLLAPTSTEHGHAISFATFKTHWLVVRCSSKVIVYSNKLTETIFKYINILSSSCKNNHFISFEDSSFDSKHNDVSTTRSPRDRCELGLHLTLSSTLTRSPIHRPSPSLLNVPRLLL